MRSFLRFIAVGSVFATVEEFLTVLVLRGDAGAYLFTLLVLFPAFLTFAWFGSRVLRRLMPSRRLWEPAHFAVFGAVGLLIEWFAIGLSPWSNPDANPILMLIFQLGMFSFWATVGFAPLLFVNEDAAARQTRSAMLVFYVPYFAFTYLVAFLAPAGLRFAAIIGLVVVGYMALNIFYVRYFRRAAGEAGGLEARRANGDERRISPKPR